MADFLSVIKEAARMCNFFNRDCNKCALSYHKNRKYISCQGLIFSYPEVYQSIVMEWSKSNPEPCYPTWEEWQKSSFRYADACINPCVFMHCYLSSECNKSAFSSGCSQYKRQIPSHVAEKLGIKPKSHK